MPYNRGALVRRRPGWYVGFTGLLLYTAPILTDVGESWRLLKKEQVSVQVMTHLRSL